MKFLVNRVSLYYNREKIPCDNATYVDRTILNNKNEPVIIRDWYIEVNNLEELIKFISINGDIVVGKITIEKEKYNNVEHEIVIYDSYLE